MTKCVVQEECENTPDGPWWTFNGECINNCPTTYENYSPREGVWTCKFCGSACPRLCPAIPVDDVTSAQSFQGCTQVNGSLIIRIDGPQNIEGELEKNLGMIDEIRGFLKVHRSFSLRSLKFLKKLRVIHGESLESKRYSVIIHDNQNLQQLWNWTNFNLEIKTGTFNFHYNPKLCMSEIETLRKISGLKNNFTEIDVSPHSNGDKFACNRVNITTEVELVSPDVVSLKWEAYDFADQQSLIGYLIYYIEAPDKNISTYDGDACGDQGWRTIFVSVDNETNYMQTIQHLEPFTQYAYYVSMAFSTGKGGQSKLSFFETLSSDPSVPVNIEVEPLGSNELLVTWEKPLKLNGILSHYEIDPFIVIDNKSFTDLRNYCDYPLQKIKPNIKPKETTTVAPINTTKCYCKKEIVNPEPVISDEFERICTHVDKYGVGNQTKCVNFNSNYRLDHKDSYLMYSEPSSHNMVQKRTSLNNNVVYRISSNSTRFIITGLKHYSRYVLLMRACNENNTTNNKTAQCSAVIQLSQRTGPKLNADDIQTPRVNIRDTNLVVISWSEPTLPNGIITSYHVEYRRVDKENHKFIIDCITRLEHEKASYQYKLHGLSPGKYSVRVKAQSLAGDGHYTDIVYFYISEPFSFSTTINAIVGVLVVLIVAAGIVFYFWYKRKHQLDSVHLITTCNPDYVGYVEDEWEMERDNVKLLQELGQGTFGTVYQGMIKDRQIPCAIKTVHEKADLHDKMEFLNEASVMKMFNDAHHVIKLLGVVSRGAQPFVVMELMGRGDLKTFLRSTRQSSKESSTCLTCSEMYRMAAEIADGMAYLAAKKFVHRDLAARNCMVSSDRTVKIGDFGMTRDIYETDYYRKETRGLLPVRWMSPESLADGIFSVESDVWSYGVVLWEIATLAEQPYQGLANEQVLQFVIAKGTLERPLDCPDLLYDIMEACWKWRPTQRPSFADIVEKLESHVGQDFKLVSFFHSREGEEFRLVKRELNKINAQGGNILFQSKLNTMPAYNNRDLAARWNKEADDCNFYLGTSPRSPRPSSSYQSSNGFMSYPLSSA